MSVISLEVVKYTRDDIEKMIEDFKLKLESL